MGWTVDSRIENPLGLCLNEETGYRTVDHKPFIEQIFDWRDNQSTTWDIYPGVNNPWGFPAIQHKVRFNIIEAAVDYARRNSDIPDDAYIHIENVNLPRSTTFRGQNAEIYGCLLYTSPSPRDRQKSRMPSSA